MKKNVGIRGGWSPHRLRVVLLILFMVLAIPLAILSFNAQQQIKWEALHQQRQQAEALSLRIDESLQALIRREEARPVADYQFVTVAGQRVDGYLQRSPLSEWPLKDAPPGLQGYFQVDGDGLLETPLLPAIGDTAQWGLSEDDLLQRRQRIAQLHSILSRQQLVQQTPAASSTFPVADNADAGVSARSEPAPEKDSEDSIIGFADVQQNFSQFSELQRQVTPQKSLGSIDELRLKKEKAPAATMEMAAGIQEELPATASKPAEPKRASRKEQLALPAQAPAPSISSATLPTTPVRLFESEVDPFEWVRLDTGQLLFFRKVWRSGERLVQGFVLDETDFYRQMIGAEFRAAPLASLNHLVVAYRGAIVHIADDGAAISYDRMASISPRDVRGTLLLQQRLSAPLGDLQLIFSVVHLPDGPGGRLITTVSILLFVLLLVVFVVIYRLGLRQLKLAEQQQNFVAAVSHELKTPLTSIRMFGEMLREGWATPEKQKEYYDFICDESERLTRLIGNVLQLARMERQELQLDLQQHSLASLADLMRSRLHSQVERNGFTLQFTTHSENDQRQLNVDADALIQILLNLVDNGVKFSRDAPKKIIEVTVDHDERQARFRVRDFGPGIPAGQQQKIFDLFYRVGNELTRETQGTGIGLALVQQLTRAMGGHIEVRNAQPGAEFTVRLPLLPA